MAFGTLNDALVYLRDELHGKGAVVVLQRNMLGEPNPVKVPYETRDFKTLQGRFQIPANYVDPSPTCNFAILLGTPENWYWEDGTGPWRSGGMVRHYQGDVTVSWSVVFVVVPNAASNSPIVKEQLK